MEGSDVDISEETLEAHEYMITTDGCFLPQPAENAPDVEVSLEDQLKSTEKLDRSSPDLWPTNRKFILTITIPPGGYITILVMHFCRLIILI